jgi:broad specificity phosphatase PhoE
VTLVGAGNILEPSRLVHIIVSPMKRTKMTLELLLPLSPDDGKIIYADDIRE